jgi:hypothetical protein
MQRQCFMRGVLLMRTSFFRLRVYEEGFCVSSGV